MTALAARASVAWLAALAVAGTVASGADPGGFFGALAAGARPAAAAVALVAGCSLVAGCGWGMLAGFGPRVAERALARVVDVQAAIPAVVLLALARSDPGERYWVVVAALAAYRTVEIARLTRWEAARVAGADHFVAAVALGASRVQLGRQHVLPLAVRPALVSASFAASATAGLEAALGYLGLASDASWGGSLATRGPAAAAGALVGVAVTTGALHALARSAATRWSLPAHG